VTSPLGLDMAVRRMRRVSKIDKHGEFVNGRKDQEVRVPGAVHTACRWAGHRSVPGTDCCRSGEPSVQRQQPAHSHISATLAVGSGLAWSVLDGTLWPCLLLLSTTHRSLPGRSLPARRIVLRLQSELFRLFIFSDSFPS
jgi:hypothetical protein